MVVLSSDKRESIQSFQSENRQPQRTSMTRADWLAFRKHELKVRKHADLNAPPGPKKVDKVIRGKSMPQMVAKLWGSLSAGERVRIGTMAQNLNAAGQTYNGWEERQDLEPWETDEEELDFYTQMLNALLAIETAWQDLQHVEQRIPKLNRRANANYASNKRDELEVIIRDIRNTADGVGQRTLRDNAGAPAPAPPDSTGPWFRTVPRLLEQRFGNRMQTLQARALLDPTPSDLVDDPGGVLWRGGWNLGRGGQGFINLWIQTDANENVVKVSRCRRGMIAF